MVFDIIVAATASSLGIGRQGKLPWRLGVDMAFFKRATLSAGLPGQSNAVIMGRKTYQSIPARFRPLNGRVNVVISRNPEIRAELDLPAEVLVASSLDDALDQLGSSKVGQAVSQVYVIGGGSIYDEAVAHEACRHLLVTMVHSEEFEDCDTHFPAIDTARFSLLSSSAPFTDKGVVCSFNVFERVGSLRCFANGPASPVAGGGGASSASPQSSPGSAAAEEENDASAAATAEAPQLTPSEILDGLLEKPVEVPRGPGVNLVGSMAPHPEMQYLALIQDIIDNGVVRGDRTGTGTVSKFGAQMRFSLRGDEFPLLTTKKVFWRGVAEELLWFVSGSTNAKLLQDKKIKIWDGNASREFLDGRGLHHREEGDLGPVYGFQWRHFGARYEDMHANYDGKGVDQLMQAINTIKSRPNDRRIIVSAWNPADLDLMALPPCHMFCQFYVANGELSCQMYQRSADMGLGVPFNIASYSLLTRMMAQVCGLKAGDFIHTIGDAHVYLNHVDALREQLARAPRPFPKLRINPDKSEIDSFDFSDFTVEGYKPHGTIKMKMAV